MVGPIEIFSERQRLLAAVARVAPQAVEKVAQDPKDKSRVEEMIGTVQQEISRSGRAGALHYIANLRLAA